MCFCRASDFIGNKGTGIICGGGIGEGSKQGWARNFVIFLVEKLHFFSEKKISKQKEIGGVEEIDPKCPIFWESR